MTVVALYRGKPGTHNAMVVDTIVSARDNPEVPLAWTDKLVYAFGNTYATVVGEADALTALRLVIDFYDPKRPKLREPATMDAVVGAIERLWRARKANYESKGSAFIFCTRDDAFYWRAGFDTETRRFKRPKKLFTVEPGACVVFWGSDVFPIRPEEFAKFNGAINRSPLETLVAAIGSVDNIARAAGKGGLRTELDGHFSGVVLPHKTSTPLTRIRPFSLPELLVREHGTDLSLLEDQDFMAYELPTDG